MEKKQTIVKKSLSLYDMFTLVNAMRNYCYGYLCENEKIMKAFLELEKAMNEDLDKDIFGNIVEQYVVTVCEE